MPRSDSFDSFDSFGGLDSFDSFDSFGAGGGGGGASSGRLAEALTRSREGHLGRPLRPGMNIAAFEFKPGLLRSWTTRSSKPNDPTQHADLPEPGPRWLVRMDSRHRMQVCVAELMQRVRFDDGGVAIKPGSKLSLGTTAELDLDRPTRKAFLEQTHRVESWAALRSERAPEILAQIAPQLPFWSSIVQIDPDIAPYTGELLAVAVALASNVVQQVKYRVVCPRPWDYSPRIQPMIPTPGHFAWPSGHATQAFMVAELLSSLLLRPEDAALMHQWSEAREQLLRQAERIATNRVVAGLHFPIDNTAGYVLGTQLARMVVDLACPQTVAIPQWHNSLTFAANLAGTEDFALTESLRALSRHYKPVSEAKELGGTSLKLDPTHASTTPVQWLWAQAHAEWHGAGQP